MSGLRSATWDAVAAAYRWQEPLERRSLDALLRHLPVMAGGLVVDVGAGPGTVTRRLCATEPGTRVIAVEPARRMVAVGRYAGAPVVRGDVTALPLPDAVADAVTAGWVLQLLEPAARASAITECARILRPGGHLGLAVPAEVSGSLRRLVRGASLAALRVAGAGPGRGGPLTVPRDLDDALASASFRQVADVRTARGYWARVVVARLD